MTLDHIDLAGTTVIRLLEAEQTGRWYSINCTGETTLTNGNAQFGSVTLSNSNLSGYLYAADSLTMHASTFSGQFVTDNFVATGSNQDRLKEECTGQNKRNDHNRITSNDRTG